MMNPPATPSIRAIVLDEAKKCVLHDRNATHGDPEDNFKTIAEYWTSYARSIGFKDITFTSKDVAAMMVLMKVSRLATSPEKLDHHVDIAGYAACGAQCAKAS